MEIVLSGEITQETTALFDALDGAVTVKLNSYGGDVSAALTIYNRLKAHGGSVEIVIEGIAASAATVIACGGRCKMAVNGLFMIHSPLLELYGDYNSEELTKKTRALRAVEDVILEIYNERTELPIDLLRQMIYEERWFTAEEAKAHGFVDEIIDEPVSVEEAGEDVIVNAVKIPVRRFQNREPLRILALGGKKMNNETLLSKVKEFFGSKSTRETALEAEVTKLRAEVERLKKEIKTADEIYALIEDNVGSGGNGVRGSTEEIADKAASALAQVVSFGNRRR